MTGGMNQEHDAFADLTPRELRAQKRNSKRQRTVDQSERLDADTAIPSDQSMGRSQLSDDKTNSPFDRTPFSVEEVTPDSPTATPTPENECQRTLRHPLHTISTSAPPLPIERWPALQDPEDMAPNRVQVPKEEIKTGLPSDLIILRDKNGRQRILVPRTTTMLHVKGTRVLHELSRSYFWPKMAEEIKALCNACIVCKRASIQRQNLSSTFRQADHKDMPLPRQAYGIDFYGHEKGEILVAVDLCKREVSLWFLPNREQ
jgi:hypothetical protein